MAAHWNAKRYGKIVVVFFAVVCLLGNLLGVVPKKETVEVRSQLSDYTQFHNGASEKDDSLQESPDHHQADVSEGAWTTRYRACVKRPEVTDMRTTLMANRVTTEWRDRMRIEDCLKACKRLTFTHSALSRGSECYCTNVTSTSPILTNVGNAHCNLPCSGDPLHNCGGQEFISVYRTSVPDRRCSAIKLGSPGSFPLVALASFPRSGNRWTRQLIKKATGYFTTIFGDNTANVMKTLNEGGEVDYKEGRSICIKTHLYNDGHIEQFESAVLLIRNPYRSIVSRAFRSKIRTTGRAWDNFVKWSINGWETTNTQWIKSQKRLLVVIYEEQERDPVAQLTRIVKFLLNGEVDRERVTCATQDHPSLLLTSCTECGNGTERRPYVTVDPFTPKMHIAIDNSIRRVNGTLIKYRNMILPYKYFGAVDI